MLPYLYEFLVDTRKLCHSSLSEKRLWLGGFGWGSQGAYESREEWRSFLLTMSNYIFPDSNNPIPEITDKVSPLMNQLLAARGIIDTELANAFLEPDYETQLHAPELLHDMEAACVRIEVAIAAGKQIAIFSDYDCDGIPGAVVLHDFFKAIGYEKFQNYIPHRHYEGFGLSEKAIDTLKADGVTLIITIDCGTTNVSEVAYAKTQGVDVIITDHHEPGEILPAAIAVRLSTLTDAEDSPRVGRWQRAKWIPVHSSGVIWP